MRKLQITAIGEPGDVLELVEFQAPAPGPGKVLVEVEAATINASDFLYISGQYFITPQPPSDVGAEGVGRVLAVGPGENEALLWRAGATPTDVPARHLGYPFDRPHGRYRCRA